MLDSHRPHSCCVKFENVRLFSTCWTSKFQAKAENDAVYSGFVTKIEISIRKLPNTLDISPAKYFEESTMLLSNITYSMTTLLSYFDDLSTFLTGVRSCNNPDEKFCEISPDLADASTILSQLQTDINYRVISRWPDPLADSKEDLLKEEVFISVGLWSSIDESVLNFLSDEC